MITKTEIQLAQSLQQKKFRQREQLFIAEGSKIVGELLNSDFTIHSLFASTGWMQKNKEFLSDINAKEVNENELKKISCLSTPKEIPCSFASSQLKRKGNEL